MTMRIEEEDKFVVQITAAEFSHDKAMNNFVIEII